MAKITRNLSTKAAREFWEDIERNAREVATWPDWKRAGINVGQVLDKPRTPPGPMPEKNESAKTLEFRTSEVTSAVAYVSPTEYYEVTPTKSGRWSVWRVRRKRRYSVAVDVPTFWTACELAQVAHEKASGKR